MAVLAPGRAVVAPCSTCKRSGRLDGYPCYDCEGTGWMVWKACPKCGDQGFRFVNGRNDRDGCACLRVALPGDGMTRAGWRSGCRTSWSLKQGSYLARQQCASIMDAHERHSILLDGIRYPYPPGLGHHRFRLIEAEPPGFGRFL